MNLYKNNKGSALVWVLVLCIIFAILGVSLGWVALSMHKRSIDNNTRTQEYYTARSACDIMYGYLNGDTSNLLSQNLKYNLVNNTTKINRDSVTDVHGEKYDYVINDFFGNAKEGTADISTFQNNYVIVYYKYEAGIVTIDSQIFALKTENNTRSQADTNIIEEIKLTARRKTEGDKWPSLDWAVNNSGKVNTLTSTGELISVGGVADRPVNEDIDFTAYECTSSISGKLQIIDDASNTQYKNGNQAIFIYVDAGQNANNLNNLTLTGVYDWNENYGPDIFVYLNQYSTLTLTDTSINYPIYVNGDTSNSGVKASNGSTISLYYANKNLALSDSTVKFSANAKDNTIPSRLPISNYSYNGAPYSGAGTATGEESKGAQAGLWEKIEYAEVTKAATGQ